MMSVLQSANYVYHLCHYRLSLLYPLCQFLDVWTMRAVRP